MAEVKTPVLDLPPTNFIRLQIYHFVRLEWFDHFITAIILMNTVTMCMDYYGASESYENVLEMFNDVFVGIFTLEALLKIIGLGPEYYFYIDWNKFDFGICILSLISVGMSGLSSTINLSALRIIRVARLLQLIKSSKELQ